MSRGGRFRKRIGGAAPREAPAPVQPALRASAPRLEWSVALLIGVLTVVAFLPALHNQFVNWDDDHNFADNPYYRGLGWPQLRWMFTAFHMGHWIPLTWMTLGLDYLVWGMNPLGYHLTNLLLHATNAGVFYFLVRRILTLALPRPSERGHALTVAAGFGALVFAIHPLRVESVAWVTERRDVVSGLFYLLTILVYLRACGRGARGRGWYWGAVALFACALLSKSMAVSLPVVLLILDVYPLRRLGGSAGWWGAPARRVYLEKIPFVLLAAAVSALAFLAQLEAQSIASLDQLSVAGRLAVSAHGLRFYLWKMVLPLNLSPLYNLSTVNLGATPFILSYGVVVAMTALASALRRRVPGLAAVWLAYVVTLLPVLGIFQNGPQIAADRYTYLAGLGWAVWAGAGLLLCWHATRFLLPGAAVCVLVGLGVLTWQQTQVWQNSETLWTHALAIDPRSSLAQNSLGIALSEQGKLAEAIEHYQQALRIKPDYALAHTNWGNALARQGKPAEAIGHYVQALRIKPDHADAHINLGAALTQQGKLAEAIEHFQQALRINPKNRYAHYNWGIALAQQGKLAEAIEQYQQALHIKPDAAAYNRWGIALADQGKLAEAIAQYQEALRIKPDHADAHSNWGVALADQGKLAEAIAQYQEALRIKPDHADAHANWGAALARQGKLAEAIAQYQEALRIKPDHADAHTNWGAALADQGDPAAAIEHYVQALRIKPDDADAHTNWGEALGQQGKPAEAILHFQQALRIKPDDADAYYNWGKALAQQGKLDEAIEHYERALKLRPSFAAAQSNLVKVLQGLGRSK